MDINSQTEDIMRFRDLAIGAWFVFASEEDPCFRFSGMARGPWIKISARKYSNSAVKGTPDITAGTVAVEIRKLGTEETLSAIRSSR